MKEKHDTIDDDTNPNNQEPNNQLQLEILACEDTLKDFEGYLLDRGFNEMKNCIESNNTKEKQKFDKFFEYFGIIIQSKQKNVIINTKKKFIDDLERYLRNIKDNTRQIEKKNQFLAIIAVALQNCKLRQSCTPEHFEYTDEIGKNLISLLSQAQYFLRYAKDCKVAWKKRCFELKDFIETDDTKYKTTDIIDANNFLYTKYQQQNNPNMILTKTGEKVSMEQLAEKHFNKISKTIYEKAENLKKNNNLPIETTIPTAGFWGKKQNHIIFSQYSNQWKNGDNLPLTINASLSDILNIPENIKQNIGQNIRIYDYTRQGFINIKNNELEQTGSSVNQYPYNTDEQRTIYVNAGDHLTFTVNEGHKYFQNQEDIKNQKYSEIEKFKSLDVNMVNTEFFRFFGADGKLCHGFFTFNNSKTSEANFQSLSMPNEFIFKGQLINARKFITDMESMLKTEAPIQIPIPKIKQDNNYNTFNNYGILQFQPEKQNNNGCCDCLKQAFPCFNNCF